MRQSAEAGYREASGAFSLAEDLLSKAISGQRDYANKFEQSSDSLDPLRVALYPREAHHIGRMIGIQQAMKERGASGWRRKPQAGCCPKCEEDSKKTHGMTEPFFDLHPGGDCGLQGILFTVPDGETEIPIPGKRPENELARIVRQVLGEVTNLERRVWR